MGGFCIIFEHIYFLYFIFFIFYFFNICFFVALDILKCYCYFIVLINLIFEHKKRTSRVAAPEIQVNQYHNYWSTFFLIITRLF